MKRPARLRPCLTTFAFASVAVLLSGVGCSSAPDGGEPVRSSDQDMLIGTPSCSPGYARVCAPGYPGVCPCQALITTESGAPDPNGSSDGCPLSAPIPVPPELEGEGCTLGVTMDGGAQRLWACPWGTPAPATIAWPASEPFGYVITVDYWYQGTSGFDSTCLGDPLPPPYWFGNGGWEFIIQDEATGNQGCHAGCPSHAPPPL
jgi:hypothetical protein